VHAPVESRVGSDSPRREPEALTSMKSMRALQLALLVAARHAQMQAAAGLHVMTLAARHALDPSSTDMQQRLCLRCRYSSAVGRAAAAAQPHLPAALHPTHLSSRCTPGKQTDDPSQSSVESWSSCCLWSYFPRSCYLISSRSVRSLGVAMGEPAEFAEGRVAAVWPRDEAGSELLARL